MTQQIERELFEDWLRKEHGVTMPELAYQFNPALFEGFKAGIAANPVNTQMLKILKELEESSYYWGEYDVPLGIHDRIKQAIAAAEAQLKGEV